MPISSKVQLKLMYKFYTFFIFMTKLISSYEESLYQVTGLKELQLKEEHMQDNQS